MYIHNLPSRRPTTHSHSSEEPSQAAHKTSRPSPTRPLSDPSWSMQAQSRTHTRPRTSTSWKLYRGQICERGLQDYQQHYCNDGRPRLQRKASDGLHVDRITHILIAIPAAQYFHPRHLVATATDRFHVPFSRTDTMKFSFVPSAIRL